MSVRIVKDVPGYKPGTSYSVSDDQAIYLVDSGYAVGETESASLAIREFSDCRSKRFAIPEKQDIPESEESAKPKRKKKKQK